MDTASHSYSHHRQQKQYQQLPLFVFGVWLEWNGWNSLVVAYFLLLVKKNNSTKNGVGKSVCVRYFIRFFFYVSFLFYCEYM